MNALTFGIGGPVQIASNFGLQKALGQVPGFGAFDNLTAATIAADKRAAQATAQDYNTRWVQPTKTLLTTGNWRPLAHQAGKNPLYFLGDVAGAKGLAGRAPNAVRRFTMRAAPESAAAARASRRLSPLSADAREAINVAENARRAAARAYGGGGGGNFGRNLRPLPFEPGAGGLHRSPRTVRSTIASEEGMTPLGSREHQVPRRPYSSDATTRVFQRAADRVRSRVGPKIEAKANDLQVISQDSPRRFQGVKQKASYLFTTEAKYQRFMKKATRDLADVWESKGASDAARTVHDAGLAKALRDLQPDKNEAGVKLRGRRISTEQMAVTLHWEDLLSPRAGLTGPELRDLVVKGIEEKIARDKAAGLVTAHRQANVDVMKAIPDKLLELTDLKDPAVARVNAAVEAGRRVDAINQAKATITADNPLGYVSEQAAQDIRSRPSALHLGGSEWWQNAVRDVGKEYQPRLAEMRARRDAAVAAGDRSAARAVESQMRTVRAEWKGRVQAIKESAGSHPKIAEARAEYQQAVAKLEQERKAAQISGNTRKVEAARISRDTYRKRLRAMERKHLGFTAPTLPELVSDRAVYLPRRSTKPKAKIPGQRQSTTFQTVPKRSKGIAESSAEWDMHPDLMLHQTLRASENYTGKISPRATQELIDTIAYHDQNGQLLTGNPKLLKRASDLGHVAFINKAKLQAALEKLDKLPQGKWLDKETADRVFVDQIPEGAKQSDYVAVHKAGKDVWTEQMRSDTPLKYWDDLTTYWKGGLLALSPRWYINNTFGLALQYGLLAGGDVQSIRRGANKQVRAAMEKTAPHIARDTLGAEAAQTGTKVFKIMQRGFDINSRLEEVWRRAAYANRAKRLLSNEGIRAGKLSNADFARALEHMPAEAIRSIARDVEYFIGDYRKFNKFERSVVKRLVPFYSWLRVISKLTFGLLFRSPLRAELLAVLGKASVAGIDPTQYQRPAYDRSAFVFGDVRVGANSANLGSTVMPFLEGLGSEHPGYGVANAAFAFAHPLINGSVSLATGTNTFGNPVAPAPGTAKYGQNPKYINRVTHVIESQPAGLPLGDLLLATITPGQRELARKFFSGGLTPRDSASTSAIITDALTGKRTKSLYYPPKTGAQASTPYSFTPYVSALTGFRITKQNTMALLLKAKQDLDKYEADQRALAAQRKRNGG